MDICPQIKSAARRNFAVSLNVYYTTDNVFCQYITFRTDIQLIKKLHLKMAIKHITKIHKLFDTLKYDFHI